ncbi:MAG: alpha/beta hydrolase [Gammaproteobacteria bacterium]|nr:alpha/beta hydrolase [Gammaproteobacteria bacterium]
MRQQVVLWLALLAAGPATAEWNYSTVAGAGGVPLNVVTVGVPDQPAILFVHGIGQSHYSFRHQLDSTLADEFFLVAFDLRGHGGSGKPWAPEDYDRAEIWARDVAAVIDAMGIRRPIMVAWSYGTLVAMDFIREHGDEELAGLVLTGAVGALRPWRMPPPDDPVMRDFERKRKLQISPNPVDNVKATDMVDWLTEAPLPEADRKLFQAIGLMFPAYARRAMVDRRFDNQDLLDRLRLPTLLALGDKDNAFLLEDANHMVKKHDNMSLSVYDSAGHSVFYEQPRRFNEELRRFAARVIATTESP